MQIKQDLTKNRTVGRIKPITKIVIHSMESPETSTTAENCARYFATTTRQASAHYCIDNDSIVQSVLEKDTAWHCPNSNADGIGFEHAGYAAQTSGQWHDAYSNAMLDLSARLAADVAKRYGIPARWLTDAQLRAGNVKGFHTHADATRAFGTVGGHTDPGVGFPRDEYMRKVASYMGTSTSSTPPAASKPTSSQPLLDIGSRGQAVKNVQDGLSRWFPLTHGKLIANSGGVDGIYGAGTKAAVASFQRAVGVDPDGVVGPITWGKLASYGIRP